MKKLFLIITIIVCLTLTLVGCSSTPVPGRAWANSELLTYDVIENEQVIGSMTIGLEVLQGEQSFNIGDDTTTKYNLGTGSSGKRLTQKVVIDGATVMESQALVKDWTTIASYKMVNYQCRAYKVSTTYQDKYVSYTKTVNGGTAEQGDIKVGSSGYIDNEFIYTYVRAFSELDSSMSKSVTTIDYENMQQTTLSLQSITANVKPFNFEGKDRKCALMSVQHSSSPIGLETIVRYFTKDAYKNDNNGSSQYDSIRIPAEIIENNITYRIKTVEVK